MRTFLDRHLDTTVRRADRTPALPRPGNQRLGNQNLRARRLALDAERRQDFLHGLDAGVRLPEAPLGPLLRADDDLPSRHWIAHPSRLSGDVGRLDAAQDQLYGHR